MFSFVSRVVLIATTVLVSDAAYSQPDTIHPRTIGQHGFMDEDWYICPSWNVFQKVEKLLKEADTVEDAQAAFVLDDRDCIKVRDQTEVIVEDTNYLWGPSALCVRPIGSPDCGWVPPGFVTATLCKPVYISKDQPMACMPRKEQDDPRRKWNAGYSGK